jgi:hypothetical protein
VVPTAGLEPARPKRPSGPKPGASTNFATSALKKRVVPAVGVEPTMCLRSLLTRQVPSTTGGSRHVMRSGQPSRASCSAARMATLGIVPGTLSSSRTRAVSAKAGVDARVEGSLLRQLGQGRTTSCPGKLGGSAHRVLQLVERVLAGGVSPWRFSSPRYPSSVCALQPSVEPRSAVGAAWPFVSKNLSHPIGSGLTSKVA